LCTASIRLQCPRAPTLRTVGDIAKSQFAKETVEVKVFEVASGIRTVGRNEVITIAARPIELSPVKMGPEMLFALTPGMNIDVKPHTW